MTDVHVVPASLAGVNGTTSAPLTLEALERAVAARTVDTVILALVDMEGRLVGKRLTARHFLESTVAHGAESCEYLLATDVDMSPQQGYGLAGWNRGFGDFELKADLSTLRLAPWQPRYAPEASRSPSPRARSCAGSSSASPHEDCRRRSGPSSSS
jgi:hypothetical protein